MCKAVDPKAFQTPVNGKLNSLFLSFDSHHRKEGSALVPIRPLSHTDCPTPAAGALACTGPTTVGYVGMAVAAHPVVHALPAWPSSALMASASTGP